MSTPRGRTSFKWRQHRGARFALRGLGNAAAGVAIALLLTGLLHVDF